MRKILVTGAAGFIGGHLSGRLLERGDHVIGLDDMNDFYSVALKELRVAELSRYPKWTLIRGDITDSALLERTFSEFSVDHIAHFAARGGVRSSIQNPYLYEDVNVRGTLTLLDNARKFGVENTVLVSSSAVYGNSTPVPFREDATPTDHPASVYAATKKVTEVLGHTYHHLYGLNINIVRPFSVYGPRGRPDMAPWMFLAAALDGRPLTKFGDGNTRRDYTYIDDFVAGFVNAIDRPLGYEIFNFGTSVTVSLNEALEIVADVTGRTLQIEQREHQPGDAEVTSANITKSRVLLGYDPVITFRQGMETFYNWLIEYRGTL